MSIPVERYADPASLEEEIEKIFWRRCFVAHRCELAAQDQYFSFRLGRRSLTLRESGSEAALLNNVCRHRFNLIDPPGFGTKSFRCAYHGWTYAASGEVSFIPMRQHFAGEPASLQRYSTREIDGFIFKTGEGREEDRFGELLVEIGPPAGNLLYRGELRHRCNWKLLVENVLEGYHLSMVHPTTFAKSGFTTSSPCEAVFRGDDSILTTYPHERFATQLSGMFPGVKPGYRHLFVFPNLFVSVTNELVYFISSFLPVSSVETLLHYRLFATTRLIALGAAALQHVRDESIRFTERALNEDKEVLESCQIGIESAHGNYVLGAHESRIEQFHGTYMRWI
jgi:phenylpropionate dioxygenase-like ring-hydroxylating dioxygenase large terminal subunit